MRYPSAVGLTEQDGKKDAQSFEILGRYEARLSKQLLQYQHELERLQAVRALTLPNHDREGVAVAQTTEPAPLNHESASFGRPTPTYLMSAQPGSQKWKSRTMTGRPVFAESARENVLFPAPAMPVTTTRRPTDARGMSLI